VARLEALPQNGGAFLCSLILREYGITIYQRYWCIAPWVCCNGASVLSTIRHWTKGSDTFFVYQPYICL